MPHQLSKEWKALVYYSYQKTKVGGSYRSKPLHKWCSIADSRSREFRTVVSDVTDRKTGLVYRMEESWVTDSSLKKANYNMY